MQTTIISGRKAPIAGRLSQRKLPIRLAGTKQRVSAVLADAATRAKNNKSSPGNSHGLAGALLAAMRVWERREQQKLPEELLTHASVREQVCSSF